MPWLIAVAVFLLLAALILWAATKVERERSGKPQERGIRINSIFSGPVGTGIYTPIDDRRKASKGSESESSENEGGP